MFRRSLPLLIFVAAQIQAASSIESFRTARWSETSTLAALPAPWRAALAKAVVQQIAEKGGRWNAGCVVDPSVPRRRFVRAGTAGGLGIVLYEHGGFVTHLHALCFTVEHESTYNVVANLEMRGVADDADLRDALAAMGARRANHS